MRLNWVRALPRGLWGSPGVPELCRSLCQRPARAPTEGGDTARTPKPQQCHPAEGDTARGDTAGSATSTWHRHFREMRDEERGAEPRDHPRAPLGGDTARGGTSGGDTSRGDTSRGETSRGETFSGDTSRGDTFRGDTFRGETSRPGTFRGGTSRGETSRGETFRGDTFRGGTFRGGTSADDTSGGDTSRGDTSGGDTFRSDTFRGDTSRGDTSGSDTFRSDTSRDETSRGDTFRGGTFRGGTSADDASRSDTSGGDTSGGDTFRAHHDPDGDPGERGPAAFEAALRAMSRSPPGRGGRLALVEAALAAMPALGAERSLAAYNGLLRLLPRGPWVPRGPVQRLLFPFPRQQECGLALLEQMERYGVVPDAETRFLLLGVFGPRSRPLRKLQRMMFWLPRFRHLDPHPLPPQLPPPGLGTARLALQRIAGDPGATVTVIQRPVPDTGDDQGSVQPYIVSSQSPDQKELLAQHDPSRPVFVEGPFPLWLRGTLLKYFILRGDPLPPHLRDPPPDPERSFYFPLHLDLDLERGPWDDEEFDVDEVEEGPVFALGMAGAGDRRTLARWISALQEHNPVLGRTPVVFRLSEWGDPSADPQQGPQTPQLGTGSPPEAELEPPEGRERGDPPKSSGE